MSTAHWPNCRPFLLVLLMTFVAACGGGGGGGGSGLVDGGDPAAPPPAPAPPPEPTPEPIELTANEAARFLSQATFGPSDGDIDQLVDIGLENWLLAELDKPATLHLQDVLSRFPSDGTFLDEQGNPVPEIIFSASDSFWEKAITADDQLRQRMAFALSQILVISSQSDLSQLPQSMAAYMDVLTAGALGNFRDLIEEVTYSPAMAIYLTYLRNQKADPATGRVPDENYAREILQLFTLGLVALNPDGTPVIGSNGDPIELYDNSDITGLAKVFTGLSFSGAPFNSPVRALPAMAFTERLQMFNVFHSGEEKAFLDTVIPEGSGGSGSIRLALDAIFAHPNVGPFLSRQLIQRFVTSAPQPAYVERVAAAFDSGSYRLPSGTVVGSGERGDLGATISAVLFDEQARSTDARAQTEFGKLREPVLRFTHWARAFQVNSADASNERLLRDTSSVEQLGQHPYRSPSVFNFYRPGYVAPGTATGAAGLTAPELQIANASTVMGYPNFLTIYAVGASPLVNPTQARAFVADYSTEAVLADDIESLLDRLDLLLTHGTLQDDTRAKITQALEVISPANTDARLGRAQLASIMIMTSPEYIVLR
ncbi:MAG: DUF1800 domain-containing protein [Pseudomonadota bacterium]